MAQATTKERLEKGKSPIDAKPMIILRKIAHPFLLAVAQTKITYKLKRENKYTVDKKKPIIFAVNHTNSQDIPLVCSAIKKHAYLLIGKQDLEPVDELFFNLNGAVFVDRTDKEDRAISKDAMVSYLKKDIPLIMFPEATWNLTDEKLMLPMRWGIIDIAKEADAQIVPVVLDYDKETKKCNVKFGKTIYPNSEKDKSELIRDLRDEMSSIRYEFIEKKGLHRRTTIDIEKEKKEMLKAVEEYPKLDYEYEKTTIFRPYTEQEEVFEPIKRLSK